MPVIEARFAELAFPPCCCSCGSRAFTWRDHTEKVVVWTLITVTKYRQITLKIPACDGCVLRPWLWFGTATGLIGLVVLYGMHASDHGRDIGLGILIPVVAAIAMVLKGQASKPLNILGVDSKDGMIKLRIRSEEVARRMLQQRGHYESEHRMVRKPLLIALGIVCVPFIVMVLFVLAQRHGA